MEQNAVDQHKELLDAITLLAGAAQAGAKGILAQAAFNVMKASEAVVKAKTLDLDQSLKDAAQNALADAQATLLKASTIPGVMDEAKQDIIKANQQPYQLAAKL